MKRDLSNAIVLSFDDFPKNAENVYSRVLIRTI